MNEINFVDIYFKTVEDRPYLGWFIQGHLVMEYMLQQAVIAYDSNLEELISSLNHYRIIKAVHGLHLIDTEQSDVLTTINTIRNRFAHRLDYMPSIEECRSLWAKAKAAFSDMTDGIEQGIAALEEVDSLEEADDFAVKELFVQIGYDLEEVILAARRRSAARE